MYSLQCNNTKEWSWKTYIVNDIYTALYYTVNYVCKLPKICTSHISRIGQSSP